MKYMVHRGHKKLWHCCSTISMLDILSEQWWFNYSGSAEHWNRSQSFAQVADWNITLHQPLLSYRGIIKKLTSFTMLSVDNQLLEASLSASMKRMSLPDIKMVSVIYGIKKSDKFTWYLWHIFSKLASRPLPALLFPEGGSDHSRDARLYVLLLLLSPALPGVLLQSVHGDVHDAPHKVEVDNGADSIC